MRETPFRRVFATKELFQGSARWAWWWSFLAAVMLCLLLCGIGLLTDLLVTRGEVTLVSNEAVAEYLKLTSMPSSQLGSEQASAESSPAERTRSDQGLRASVWLARGWPWGRGSAEIVKRVPSLQSTNSALLVLLVTNIGLGLLASFAALKVKTHAFRASQKVATLLRQTLHRQALRLGPSDLDDMLSLSAFRMFTEDVERLRQAVQTWSERIVRGPLLLLALLSLMLATHWLLTLQCLVPLVASWLVIRYERQRFEQSRRRLEENVHDDLRVLAEGMKKARVVRGFGMENFEHERFRVHLNRFLHKVETLKEDERFSRWLCWIIVLCSMTLVSFLIATKALAEPSSPAYLPISAVLMFVAAARLSLRPLNDLAELPHVEQSANRWAENLLQYQARIPEVGQTVGAKFLQPLSKQIQLESVTYRLPNQRVLLDHVDLRLPALRMYAVLSLDPIEARALTYLLPRFIEPHSGRVLIDGEDLAFVTLESLRAEAVFVGGTDPFFTGSVAENISCGDPRFALPQITEAAKQVHAHQFISKLPQGYETLLGEHGVTLGTAQTYLLGLARALIRDPALLIIEEPAERLDEDTKALLDDAYSRLAKDRTLIFLPSRLSTVRKADQVIFLHKGKVEALGPYQKLITSSSLMRHWEYVRFNEFQRSHDANG